MKKNFGVFLIVLGLIIFLENNYLFTGDLTLLMIGLGFIISYFLSGSAVDERNIGFLIPGTITLMLGIFANIEELYLTEFSSLGGPLFFIFIGTAFWLVYLIHTSRKPEKSRWPAVTGGALYLFGIFVFMAEYVNWERGMVIIENIWPAGLILAGVYFLINGYKE